MTQPGSYGYGAPLDPITRLVRDVEDLKRQVREMQSLQVYSGTTQSPNFDGDAATNTAGTMGYGLDGPTGNAVFNNVTFRNAIIGDDALVNPIAAQVHDDNTAVSSVPHASTTLLTSTITVPAGFSQALVMAVGHLTAINTTVGTDFIFLAIDINGTVSSANETQALTGARTTLSNSQGRILTGLTGGGTFTTSIVANVNGATAWSPAAGFGRISTSVSFLR